MRWISRNGSWGSSNGSLGEEPIDGVLKLLFGLCADALVDLLAIFEKDQAWNAHDLKFRGDFRVLVGIQFQHLQSPIILRRQFFDDGGGFLGELDSGIDPALVVGGGFRYGLSPMIGLRLDVRDYISSYGLSLEGQELDSQLQNDILISGGVEFGF